MNSKHCHESERSQPQEREAPALRPFDFWDSTATHRITTSWSPACARMISGPDCDCAQKRRRAVSIARGFHLVLCIKREVAFVLSGWHPSSRLIDIRSIPLKPNRKAEAMAKAAGVDVFAAHPKKKAA